MEKINQKGRGRTTTGMIVSCLVAMAQGYIDGRIKVELGASEKNGSPTASPSPSDLMQIDTRIGERKRSLTTVNTEIKERLLRGEYKVVIRLIRVIYKGRVCKILTDRAVDQCSHIQNLREAIYDTKMKHDMLERTSPERPGAFHRAFNYLARYFYLVAFTGYLLETLLAKKENPDTHPPTFVEWIRVRPELSNLLNDTDDFGQNDEMAF